MRVPPITAAMGVFGTGGAWPDVLVAVLMALLGLAAARSVITQASREMRAPANADIPGAPSANG